MPKQTKKRPSSSKAKARVSKPSKSQKLNFKSTKAKLIIVLVIAMVGVLLANFIFAATLTPPAADSDKMIGVNGTHNVDKYVADAQDMGTKWFRVEQWGDSIVHTAATYDKAGNVSQASPALRTKTPRH